MSSLSFSSSSVRKCSADQEHNRAHDLIGALRIADVRPNSRPIDPGRVRSVVIFSFYFQLTARLNQWRLRLDGS